MKTVKHVMDYLGLKEGHELHRLILSAYADRRIMTQRGIRLGYDYSKLKAFFIERGESLNIGNLVRSLTNCDGTCSGCIEGCGVGCDAIAVVFVDE